MLLQTFGPFQCWTNTFLNKSWTCHADTKPCCWAAESLEELAVQNVGKIDPKKHLESDIQAVMGANIVQALGTMLDTVVF